MVNYRKKSAKFCLVLFVVFGTLISTRSSVTYYTDHELNEPLVNEQKLAIKPPNHSEQKKTKPIVEKKYYTGSIDDDFEPGGLLVKCKVDSLTNINDIPR